jgi:nucleotide-binding universal stress UspA family protein
MIPFRSILCAVDFSESSREAFRVACSLAQPESRLVLLHVIEPSLVFSELGAPSWISADGPELRASIENQLREFYVPDRAIEIEYRAAEGSAAESIIRAGDEIGSDLIVLATHGRSGLERLLIGSVAESVLRKATRPVLALRTPSHLVGAEPPKSTVQGG